MIFEMNINTVYDIQQLLLKFGVVIYTKDRFGDLELMQMEIRDLYEAEIIDIRDYQICRSILQQEIIRLKQQENL